MMYGLTIYPRQDTSLIVIVCQVSYVICTCWAIVECVNAQTLLRFLPLSYVYAPETMNSSITTS